MKKHFFIVAYDVADKNRRDSVAEILGNWGRRSNWSVFECPLSVDEYTKVKKAIETIINEHEDRVIFYPLCLNCRSSITRLGYINGDKLDHPLLVV